MRRFAVLSCLFAALVTLPLAASAAADEANPIEAGAGKPEAIRIMMKEMRVDNLSLLYGQTMTVQIYQALKASRPELPLEALSIIREEVERLLDRDSDTLLEQIAGIYDRAFSEAEVRELTKFYQSEIGRKTMTVIPQIMQESLLLGKSWGQSIGSDLLAHLEERFKEVKPEPAK